MNINQLNDDCLEAIFRQLPLQNSVRARIICQGWKAVIEARICQTQKSLMLFNSYQDILRYCDFLTDFNVSLEDSNCEYGYEESKDLIFHGGLNAEKCRFVMQLFPNIQTLTLFYTKFTSVNDIVILLCGWNESLQSLILVHPHRGIDLALAFKSIDILALPNLKSLTLTGERRFLLKTSIKLPKTIGRLEEFTLGLYACDIGSVLQQLGPKICKLRFHALKLPLTTLEDLVLNKPYMKTRLTHLSIDGDTIKKNGNAGGMFPSMDSLIYFPYKGISKTTMRFISTNFKALTYLDITPSAEVSLLLI